jgi:hypothetical protein
MLGVQAAGAAPLVHGERVERPETVASAIGVFCEPASAASVAGLLKHGARGASRVRAIAGGGGARGAGVGGAAAVCGRPRALGMLRGQGSEEGGLPALLVSEEASAGAPSRRSLVPFAPIWCSKHQ